MSDVHTHMYTFERYRKWNAIELWGKWISADFGYSMKNSVNYVRCESCGSNFVNGWNEFVWKAPLLELESDKLTKPKTPFQIRGGQ